MRDQGTGQTKGTSELWKQSGIGEALFIPQVSANKDIWQICKFGFGFDRLAVCEVGQI